MIGFKMVKNFLAIISLTVSLSMLLITSAGCGRFAAHRDDIDSEKFSDTSSDFTGNEPTCDFAENKLNSPSITLKDAYIDHFPIGVAVSSTLINDYGELISKHFNSLTAENEMKPAPLRPGRYSYYFERADALVDFAIANNMKVRGHTLIWHSQTPAWTFTGQNGERATKEELLMNMEDHIKTVVGRYKGKVYAWDVVNEAVSDGYGEYLRNTAYLEIIGEEYLEMAFIWAHEADPDALLFYNDYGMENPYKRERVLRLLKSLLEKDVPIHGVGIQGHYNIFSPSVKDIEDTIDSFAALGLQVHITELDISIYAYHESDTRFASFPEDREKLQIHRYTEIFNMLRRRKEHVTSVTFWGLSDDLSWLNNFPVRGRKNWPLLFDQYKIPKESYNSIVDFD